MWEPKTLEKRIPRSERIVGRRRRRETRRRGQRAAMLSTSIVI
jgi:hypothetical protein